MNKLVVVGRGLKQAFCWAGQVTNATKGQLMVLTNSIMAAWQIWSPTFSQQKQGAVALVVNAFFGWFIAATFTMSNKRTDQTPCPVCAENKVSGGV